MKTVLIIDNTLAYREFFRTQINWEQVGYKLIADTKSEEDSFIKYLQYKPYLIIINIEMPLIDGFAFIKKIKSITPHQKIIILGVHENFAYAKKALQLGVSDYFIKAHLTADDFYNALNVPIYTQQLAYSLSVKHQYTSLVQNTISYIEQHYTNDFKLNDLATLLHTNQSYLSRTFKKQTGQTITHFINTLRINKAIILMDDKSNKMIDIAFSVGYNTTQNFYYAFQQITGICAKNYRKNHF